MGQNKGRLFVAVFVIQPRVLDKETAGVLINSSFHGSIALESIFVKRCPYLKHHIWN